MQRKDLEEQLDLLKTAVMEKQPSSNVIPILRKLQAEVAPTEEILRVSHCLLSLLVCYQHIQLGGAHS